MSPIAVRNVLDVSAFAGLVVAMDYYFTGNVVHEVCCTLLLVLLVLHNVLNRAWYGTLRKRRASIPFNLRRVVNLLLAASLSLSALSGILISRTLFRPISVSGQLWVHELHTCSSYAGFVLCGVHVGLHGRTLVARACRWLGVATERRDHPAWRWGAALLLVGLGVHASFARHVGAKLLLEPTYGSWTGREVSNCTMMDYCAILGCYLMMTHLLMELLPGGGRGKIRRALP